MDMEWEMMISLLLGGAISGVITWLCGLQSLTIRQFTSGSDFHGVK
jgi:hypothetical protein